MSSGSSGSGTHPHEGDEEDFGNIASGSQSGPIHSHRNPAHLQHPSPLRPFVNRLDLTTRSPASSSRTASPSAQPRARELRDLASRNASDINLGATGVGSEFDSSARKNADLDWYVEGPGRRVGYDDLTAIDWIFEYTKERQRRRRLFSSNHGLLGSLRQVADASHVWVVLVLTGIAVGVLAAAINIAGDWLGDTKVGFCKRGQGGGQFYLNRAFCCWGHDDIAQCQDWTPWRDALRLSSVGGAYVVEYIFFVLYSILFATLAAVLTSQYAIYAKQSGIPEIKTVLGGFIIRRFMGGWTLAIKSVGLCLAVASGLWLGKEGPLVHVACCCANLIMKPFGSINENEARKREVLSAASASGISVAFGAPVGGVLFSLEQLSYYFPDKTMWQSFVCAMVAAVTLQALNPFHTGKIVLYEVTYTTGWHSFEMGPFILLGLVGGLYGGLFTRLNIAVAKWRRSEYNPLLRYPIATVAIVAAVSAIINFPNTFMRAQMSELVEFLFTECASIANNDVFGLCKVTTAGAVSIVTLLVSAAFLGSLLAATTFGLPIPAGVMLPSIAIGALYGRALGIVVELFQKHHPTWVVFAACEPDVPCITPGTYAIVGAASALAGVTRMTVSIVVIMFELTGALAYVLPIMIAVMLAKWIADVFSKRGIYESWIQLNEYPYLDNKDEAPVADVSVSNIMTRVEEMTSIDSRQPHTIGSLSSLLKQTTFRGFPVISSHVTMTSNTLLGYISRTELSYALTLATSPSYKPQALADSARCHFVHTPHAPPTNTLDLRPWMDQTPITLNANSSFQLAVNIFQKLGLRYLLFVDRGALKGLLTKKDVWFVLNAGENATDSGKFVAGAGVLREEAHEGEDEGNEEERGLLQQT